MMSRINEAHLSNDTVTFKHLFNSIANESIFNEIHAMKCLFRRSLYNTNSVLIEYRKKRMGVILCLGDNSEQYRTTQQPIGPIYWHRRSPTIFCITIE